MNQYGPSRARNGNGAPTGSFGGSRWVTYGVRGLSAARSHERFGSGGRTSRLPTGSVGAERPSLSGVRGLSVASHPFDGSAIANGVPTGAEGSGRRETTGAARA